MGTAQFSADKKESRNSERITRYSSPSKISLSSAIKFKMLICRCLMSTSEELREQPTNSVSSNKSCVAPIVEILPLRMFVSALHRPPSGWWKGKVARMIYRPNLLMMGMRPLLSWNSADSYSTISRLTTLRILILPSKHWTTSTRKIKSSSRRRSPFGWMSSYPTLLSKNLLVLSSERCYWSSYTSRVTLNLSMGCSQLCAKCKMLAKTSRGRLERLLCWLRDHIAHFFRPYAQLWSISKKWRSAVRHGLGWISRVTSTIWEKWRTVRQCSELSSPTLSEWRIRNWSV